MSDFADVADLKVNLLRSRFLLLPYVGLGAENGVSFTRLLWP